MARLATALAAVPLALTLVVSSTVDAPAFAAPALAAPALGAPALGAPALGASAVDGSALGGSAAVAPGRVGGVVVTRSAGTGGSVVTHYTGTLADGATWIADVPGHWHGALILYSHGFGTLAPADAPSDAARQALLDRGYALTGSSYDPNGSLWALASATRDQFGALAAVSALIGRPRIAIALGTSMGGLISTQEAERAGGRLDAVVSTCGLLGGGIDLNNYQLDGEYALSRLLAPAQTIPLVGYASPADGAASRSATTGLRRHSPH